MGMKPVLRVNIRLWCGLDWPYGVENYCGINSYFYYDHGPLGAPECKISRTPVEHRSTYVQT